MVEVHAGKTMRVSVPARLTGSRAPIADLVSEVVRGESLGGAAGDV